MNCKLSQHEIDQADLNNSLSRDTAKHMEFCAVCRSFKNERESLRVLLGSLERVAVPANFDLKLRARLTQSETEPQRKVWHLQPSFLRTALSVSFALTVVVAGAVSVKNLNNAYSNNVLNVVSVMSSLDMEELRSSDIEKKNEQTAEAVLQASQEELKATTLSGSTAERRFRAFPKKDRAEKSMSVDISSGKASVQIPPEFGGAAIIVPVDATSRSHYVIVDNKKVPLRSVTFGSQGFVGGNETPRTVFTSNAQRVW